MPAPATAIVEIEGVRLWTVTQGTGPPLVFCHGGPGLWDDLGKVADMIDDRVTVHRYDQRGSGRSGRTPPFDLATFVSDLEGLRRHEGYERWMVGGHSWGASLALAYAVSYPDRITALLYLSGTGLNWDWKPEQRRQQDARLTQVQRAELEVLESRRSEMPVDSPKYREIDRRICLLRWSTDFAKRDGAVELASALFEEDLLPNYEVNQALEADWKLWLSRIDIRHLLAALAGPALVVHGGADPRPAWIAEEVADALPDARLEILEGVGHFPWLERPERLRGVLRRFLADYLELVCRDDA